MNTRETLQSIFLRRVNKTETCWLWCGGTARGYGIVTTYYKKWPAHRRSYTLFVRPLNQEEHLHHKCKNKLCVNPAHLEVVVEANHPDNITVINKNKTVCNAGHELNKRNTYIRPDGSRNCRVCSKLKMRITRQKLKGEN